jgi:c-di-GMP-binding flagellar brake protein YcgR
MEKGFMPVRKADVALGRPLPYSLYDGDRNLLLRAGCIVQTQNQLDQLSEKGLYRNSSKSVARDRHDTVVPDAEAANDRQREASFALDELKLSIGDALQLQGAAEGDSTRFPAKLIGFVKGRSVLVTTPTVEGKVAFIREGQSFVVRMFCGTSAYAFTASVIKPASVPFPHLHLTYPSSVRGLAVRRGARARVRVIVAASDSKGKVHAGTLCDLSLGGAMMVCTHPPGEIGDTLKLKFRVTLNDVEHYLHPEAVIRSIAVSDGSIEGIPPGYQAGLQFAVIPPEESLALTACVYENLLRESGDF